MKKIICIGECSLNIVLDADGKPSGSMPGGRIANAAAMLARLGINTVMASEAAADNVGDIIVNFLADAGADINSVDRFTEGRTPLNVFTTAAGGSTSLTRYENYPDEAFDIIWPRIDPDDIVIFGGYYAIDARMRPRMLKLLAHAVERKAVMVYLPGYLPQQEPRITRVMPAILENLEMADIVITRNSDLSLIFGTKEPQDCYSDHIDFYCRSLVNINEAAGRISYFTGNESSSVETGTAAATSLLGNAGVVAGLCAAVFNGNIDKDTLEHPDANVRETLLKAAADNAALATASLSESWQLIQ
ncbi:MAG: hypothetical protein K2I69_09320 [Muribaculaceae bacterium]|nr:hypothetical protein [Muribaculaceae bacterium]